MGGVAKYQTMVKKRKPGRPTRYSAKLATKVCDQLSRGLTLQQTCRLAGLPSVSTVQRWRTRYREFDRELWLARTIGSHVMLDKVVSIADSVVDPELVPIARLQIDARRWYVPRVNQMDYGDNIKLRGDRNEPLTIVDLTRRAKEDDDADD